MCGIAGVLQAGDRPVDAPVLEAMAAALAHRGPDQSGVLAHGPVGLAATRLSLLDLGETGAQPQADGSRALVFNGEVYNHRELAAELTAAGVVLRGRSDTEVLLHALGRWGVAATLPRLRGMFAFAYADLATHEVWLARDRLGIKPLVWREHAGTVSWASEAKALAAVQPLEPDPVQAVFAVTGRLERSAHRTAFLGVHRLPPGHVLHLAPGRPPRATAWWTPADVVDEGLHRELAGCTDDERADRLEALLAGAVAATAVSDAPVATFLSGGVDSSLVAALARTSDPTPTLYTADVGGGRSEVPAARTVAALLGQPLTTAPFPVEAVLEDWALATWHAEAPLVTHLNALPFRRLAARAAADGRKAVLTGEGADELFFGYGEIAAGRLTARVAAPWQRARRLAARLPAPLGPALARRATSQADFLVDLAGDRRGEHLRAAGADAFAFLPPADAARHGEVFAWLGEHLPTLLHRNDAMGMAASIEARFPYLDEDVVRFGVNLPVGAKLAVRPRAGDLRHPFVEDKAVLRQVAARHLPEAVARREKAGFPSPGHGEVRTTRAFWSGGYVADLLGLTEPTLDDLDAGLDPYLVAKLASVEVFGRLFGRGEPLDVVGEHVARSARCTDQ